MPSKSWAAKANRNRLSKARSLKGNRNGTRSSKCPLLQSPLMRRKAWKISYRRIKQSMSNKSRPSKKIAISCCTTGTSMCYLHRSAKRPWINAPSLVILPGICSSESCWACFNGWSKWWTTKRNFPAWLIGSSSSRLKTTKTLKITLRKSTLFFIFLPTACITKSRLAFLTWTHKLKLSTTTHLHLSLRKFIKRFYANMWEIFTQVWSRGNLRSK